MQSLKDQRNIYWDCRQTEEKLTWSISRNLKIKTVSLIYLIGFVLFASLLFFCVLSLIVSLIGSASLLSRNIPFDFFSLQTHFWVIPVTLIFFSVVTGTLFGFATVDFFEFDFKNHVLIYRVSNLGKFPRFKTVSFSKIRSIKPYLSDSIYQTGFFAIGFSLEKGKVKTEIMGENIPIEIMEDQILLLKTFFGTKVELAEKWEN